MSDVFPLDTLIARAAQQQHGLVTRMQLTDLGLTNKAIEGRVRRGQLHRVHRGVFLVGHRVFPEFARAMAAVLACACGPGALASHRAAAWLWRWVADSGEEVDVTVHGRKVRHQPGIRTHLSKPLDRYDVRRLHGIPITSPARTLLDFAEVAEPRELERAFDEALTQRRVTRAQLRDVIERNPGRHGIAPLAELLERDGGSTISRSEAEELMLALVRAAGLPKFDMNRRVNGHRLDFWWPEVKLNVEVDSRTYHSQPKRVDSDRERDADLELAGITVRRFTRNQVKYKREWTIARLAHAYALAGVRAQ